MRIRGNTILGIAIALIGLGSSFAEFLLHWRAELQRPPVHYDIDPWVAFGGAIFAFVGGAIANLPRAERIANVVVSSSVTILGALPFVGRRWTDRVAEKTQAAADANKPDASLAGKAKEVMPNG